MEKQNSAGDSPMKRKHFKTNVLKYSEYKLFISVANVTQASIHNFLCNFMIQLNVDVNSIKDLNVDNNSIKDLNVDVNSFKDCFIRRHY
jgi:hypothetical protein